MCGILGIAGTASHSIDAESIQSALNLMRQRGPDDRRLWREERVLLGHTRLAILDLSTAGSQPMESVDHRYVITFNGEIYNHLELRDELRPAHDWRGSSDTETLLEGFRQWGPSVLAKLNGMFAFAIWDRLTQQLFIARDRLGEKPLYFCRSPFFAFASRPAALARLRESSMTDFDSQALRYYMELGYVPAPHALLKGMYALPPAHYAIFNSQGLRQVRYWDYRHIRTDSDARKSDEALADELDEKIRRAVKLRMLADVPLGAFLSGGVDSAMVVAAMVAAKAGQVKTFTIGFAEKKYDESDAAAQIARHLGVEHVVETLGMDDLLKLLPDYQQDFDEPLSDSTAFSNMAVARLARRHVKVALCGDAADELFGGYHYYSLMNRLASLTQKSSRWRTPLRWALGIWPTHRAKLLSGAMRANDPVALFAYMRSISKDYPQLLDDGVLCDTHSALSHFETHAASMALDLEPAEIGMRSDIGTLLPNGYLRKLDCATMAFSLEGRCPFTDFELVEWSMRLPTRLKVSPQGHKVLLKKVLTRYLPQNLVYQPKRGFVVPIADWLRGPLRSWASDLIHDDQLLDLVPLNRRNLRLVLGQHLSGSRNAQPLLWAALMLLCVVARDSKRHGLPAVSSRIAA